MSELAGKSVVIKVGGTPVVMTNEPTTGTGNLVYQIASAAHQVIDPLTTLVVKNAGTPTTEAYTVNHMNGKITFATAVARTITVTGAYVPMSVAGYGVSMSRNMTADLLDANQFGVDYKSKIAGQLSASGTLKFIDVTDSIFLPYLTAGNPVVIEDLAASGGLPNRVYALLENIEDTADVTGLQERTIGWSSKDEFVRLGV